MSRGSIFACAAVLVVLSAAPAAAQPPQDIFERKQAFVAAIRQFSISIAGRFGDEGRRLRADVDAMEAALREWDRAIAAFESALRGGRLDADAYIALGSVQLDRHRVQDAVRSFSAAAKLAPKRAEIHELIAMAHGLAGQPSAATRALARAAALRPDDVVVRYELARYAMESDAASRSPAVFTAFQNAAARHLASGAVAVTFSRAGAVAPDRRRRTDLSPAPYVAAFGALMDGRFEDAIAESRKALVGDPLLRPAGDDALLAAGADALRRGDVPGALRQFTAAVAASGSAESHRSLGTAYRLDDQLERSVEAYSTAIRLEPSDERARIGLADVLIDLERFDEAERGAA